MSLRKAEPPVAKSSNARAIHGAKTVTPKEQADFDDDAAKLCASLGWEGNGEWVLDGIQVADAFKFLRKTLHEKHVHEVAPNRCACPTVESVASHLGIEEKDRLALLRAALGSNEEH